MAITGTLQERYNKVKAAAKAAGDPHPDVVAAQWALESGWGKSVSGTHNYFGIKAVGNEPYTLAWTHEVINGKRERVQAKFKNYSSLEEGIKDRVDFMRRNKRYVKAGYFTAPTATDAVYALHKAGYATETQSVYVGELLKIMKKYGDPGAPVNGDPTSIPATDDEIKRRVDELKRQVDLNSVLNNISNLEQHQVPVTWGSRISEKEQSDWIGLKQFILYLSKTFNLEGMIPLSELIPIFTLDSGATATNQLVTNKSGVLTTQIDKLLNRYDNTAAIYEEMKSSGGIDLLSLDPFREIGKFNKTRNLSYKTIGNLTLNPSTDGSTLSKPGAVGVKRIKVSEGDDTVMNQAYIEIELEDVAGNKFLDPASPWSFVLNYSTFTGDFLFRYGWQITLPKYIKGNKDINSIEYKFWNHEGWRLFGNELKNELISKLSKHDWTISLTQSLDTDALWYKGFRVIKENGAKAFVRDLITEERLRNKYYMTLGMTYADLKVDSQNGSVTAILSFMTTNTLANLMCPITQKINIEKLLGEIQDGKTNLFELISAFYKDNQEYVKTLPPDVQAKYKELYSDFTQETNKENICKLIQVIPIEDNGLGYSGTFVSKDPREVPIIITDEMKQDLKAQQGDDRKLWAWVRDVLHKNNLDDAISANNHSAYFTFIYDDRKSKQDSESEFVVMSDLEVANASGFLTERSYNRIFTFDDVFSFRFQGSLVHSLDIEKADMETMQSIQAADNMAEQIAGTSEIPSGTENSTTSNQVAEQPRSVSGTDGNRPTNNVPDANRSGTPVGLVNPVIFNSRLYDGIKDINKYRAKYTEYVENKLNPTSAGVSSASASRLMAEAIAIASTYVGVKEVPNNTGPEVTKFLKSVGLPPGHHWCMAFAYFCYDEASKKLNLVNPLKKTGHCMTQWDTIDPAFKSSTPVPGSVFIMNKGGGRGHAGLVTAVNGDKIETIEGNTSNSVTTKTRKISSVQNFINISATGASSVAGGTGGTEYGTENGASQYNPYDRAITSLNYGHKEDLLRYWLSTMRNTSISALGHPWLQLSKGFFIKGTGSFDGRYYITKLEHIFERNSYTTEIKGISAIFADANFNELQANLEGQTLQNVDLDSTGRVNKSTPVLPSSINKILEKGREIKERNKVIEQQKRPMELNSNGTVNITNMSVF